MLERMLKIVGIKQLAPAIVDYLDTIIWNFILMGVGIFSDLLGFILFGAANILIYLTASIYTYKTKRVNPIFDFLYGSVILVAAISASIFFIGKNLFMVILCIAATILVFYGLCKQLKKTYFKS